jgi:hypothetical protein
MPRAAISETFKTADGVDQYDYLKLDTGEWARLLVIDDENAWWEWVHSMRAPVIDDEDMPVMVNKTRRDGSSAGLDYSMGFVGQRICLGDPSVVEDKGLDVARCPACESAGHGTKGMAPERRFAVPVIRYKCKKRNSTDLQSTPGGDILVWKLGQRLYNQLIDNKKAIRELLEIPEEQKTFPLRSADIVIECEDGNFNRLAFKPPMRPAYRDPKVFEWVKELKADKDIWPTDAQLKAACGRDGDRDHMVMDVQSVEDRWRKAERAGKDGVRRPDPTGNGPVSNGQAPQDVDASLTDLLADHPGGLDEFAPAASAGPAVSDDPFAEEAAAPAVAAPAASAAPAPSADPFAEDAQPALAAAAAPAASGRVQSFVDILAD